MWEREGKENKKFSYLASRLKCEERKRKRGGG
jgi:hypothetical protein